MVAYFWYPPESPVGQVASHKMDEEAWLFYITFSFTLIIFAVVFCR